MELKVKRLFKKSEYTIGKMYIDGKYFCDTVEDTDRDISCNMPLPIIKGVKVYGQTAIPTGTYNVSLTYSPKFRKVLPLIENVKGFDGVRIHSGNTAADSLGCIIVGENKIKGGVINSRATMEKLMNRLSSERVRHITIKIC